MTSLMSTSLNVVSNAAVCCASTSRRAMVRRSGLIATDSSRRAPATAVSGCAVAAGPEGAAGALPSVPPASRWRCTSSFRSRPPGPVARTSAAERPCSSRSLRAAGMTALGSSSLGLAGPAAGLSAADWGVFADAEAWSGSDAASAEVSAEVSADASAAAPASIRAMTSPTSAVSPSSLSTSCRTPASEAGTSSVALSVSTSTRGSSFSTRSPGCFSQAPMNTSLIDSPTEGTLTSVIASPRFGRASPRRRVAPSRRALERVPQKLFLLELMGAAGAGGRAGRRRSGHAVEAATERLAAPRRAQEPPGAHVLRLLLDPDQRGVRRVERQRLLDLLVGPRVELLEAHDGDVVALALLALGQQVVVHLAAARQDPGDAVGHHLGVEQHAPETAAGEVVQRRHRPRRAQQALRRHHDQRLAPGAQHLPPKQVEHLRGGRRVRHLHVGLGAQLEEPLEPGRGVLRTLALEPVGQQHRETGEPAPLVLAAGDELVDDHLRGVHEVAELRF